MINRLRVLAGLDPIRESYDRPHFDHAAYAEKVKHMSEEQLRFIIKDAQEAIKANPDSPKSKYGYYADEINYCSSELHRRKKTQQPTESLEAKEKVIVEEPKADVSEVKTELEIPVVEELAEVPEIKFDTPDAFTSDEFDGILKKSLNNINSIRDDSQASKLNKYKTPKDVIKACKDRIREIEDSIAVDDEKGYNDHSVKVQAIECIEQILKDLSSNDQEGYKQAVIYHTTLAGQYLHWLPNQLIKYLTNG
jgi:hypothetical protein